MRLFHLLFGGGRILRLIGNKEFARCTMIFLAYSENFHTIRQMYFVSSRKGKKNTYTPNMLIFPFFYRAAIGLVQLSYPLVNWLKGLPKKMVSASNFFILWIKVYGPPEDLMESPLGLWSSHYPLPIAFLGMYINGACGLKSEKKVRSLRVPIFLIEGHSLLRYKTSHFALGSCLNRKSPWRKCSLKAFANCLKKNIFYLLGLAHCEITHFPLHFQGTQQCCRTMLDGRFRISFEMFLTFIKNHE